jgi:murein L,D-transpeptidase YafK
MSHIMTILLAFGLAIAGAEEKAELNGASTKPDPAPVTPAKDTIPEGLVQLGTGQYFSSHAFVMDKATRTLTVWKNGPGGPELVTAVAADFGRNNGDKTISGDHKTPEGIYFFQEAKEGAELSFDEYGVKAFTLDYPNFFDSRERKSGNGIWLHAIPDSKSLWRGSRGCVVVRNDVIKNLSPFIALRRTPMLIQDNVKLITREAAAKVRGTWASWLEQWRAQWETKDIDGYISHYGDGFKALGMNRDKWREYKKSLSEKYSFIKVGLTEPLVIRHNDELVVRFLQDYQSDKNADFGQKTLYLHRNGEDQFKIIGEEWQAARRDDIVATH